MVASEGKNGSFKTGNIYDKYYLLHSFALGNINDKTAVIDGEHSMTLC